MREFEPQLESLSLHAYSDSRFDVFIDEHEVYRSAEHKYRLPIYDEDIRPAIERMQDGDA